jgi:DNA-binding Lrp family transcriptional regulator
LTVTPGPLDRIDRQLLALLQKNARSPNTALAERVGLAPSSCFERVRRLREQGYVTGFHAEVDLARLGRRTQALIGLRLATHDRAQIAALEEHLLELDDVLTVFHVSGADDYLLHVAVRDTEHLRALVLDQLTDRAEVAHVETRLIFQAQRKRVIEPLD